MPSITRTRKPAGDTARTVHEQVLAAVERLLSEGHGFTELGVGRIADEAGIGRSTFYGHFPDKPTLLIRLAGAVTGDLFDRARVWALDPEHSQASLAATLGELVDQHRRHAHLIRAVGEVAGYDERVRASWRAQIDGFADVLRGRLVADAAARTGAAPLADGLVRRAAVTASYAAWGTERTIALHVERRPPEEDAAFVTALAAASWTLLKA